MRRLFILASLFVMLGAAPAPVVTISAQEIALHPDRGLLIASGGVSLKIGNLVPIQATRASYDLRTNVLRAIGDSAGTGYVYDFNKATGTKVADANVPQIAATDALAVGQQVELRPGQSITFSNAQVLAGSAFVPTASYTYGIPPPRSKDFGYSPAPAAALDYAVFLGATNNAYAFTRLRYDKYTGGPGAGLEEHYARTDRGYVALGETLDRDGARYDLAAYQRLNDSLSQSLTASLLGGIHTARYALTASGVHGYTSFSISQFNNYRDDDLMIRGSQRPIGRVAYLRLFADFSHDVHPFDRAVAQDYRVTPGMHLDTAAWHIGAASLSASADLGEALYNYGRATLATSATLWSNVPVNNRLQFSGGATFSHNAPPYPMTYRTYTIADTWRASDAFNLVSSLTYAHDYGQFFGGGRPQFIAAIDIRVRRRNHTGFEMGVVEPFGGVGNMYRVSGFNLRFFKW